MAAGKDKGLKLANTVEEAFDKLRFRVKRSLNLYDPAVVLPYRGFGTHRHLWIKGRVLEERGVEKPEEGDTTVDNIVRMFHRYESDEIPRAKLRVRFGGDTLEVESDEEGFFEASFDADLDDDPQPEQRWREVEITLLEPLFDGQDPPTVAGQILTPPASAQFGVISDIDDTIVKTGATKLLKHWRTVLVNNAESRTPFRGLPAFYRALARGTLGEPVNPIFYVSSSPWNLFDLFERFMEIHEIPVGPMLLKNFGLDRKKLFTGGHDTHKLSAIERILATYPQLKFILIGDSGQRDAEIYRQVAERHEGRIAAVFIRDVSEGKRDKKAQELLDALQARGIRSAYGPELLKAAEAAEDEGLVAPGTADEVSAAVAAVVGDPWLP